MGSLDTRGTGHSRLKISRIWELRRRAPQDINKRRASNQEVEMVKIRKIVYTPVRDWGRESKVIYGERQYMLDEVTGWMAIGRFQELVGQEILEAAQTRTEE